MKKKITVLTLCATLFALCWSAQAQQPGKIPRIGYTAGIIDSPTTPEFNQRAFRKKLTELGYVEGKNIAIEIRKTGYRTYVTEVQVRRGETVPLNVSLRSQDQP